MAEDSWPEVPPDWPVRVQRAWPATVAALPHGTRIGGKVIGRQRFGLFVDTDGLPETMALVQIITMTKDALLSPLGARIISTVIGHAPHDHQVNVKLTEWGG